MLTKLISHEWKDTFKVPALLLTITVLLSAASLVYFSVADQASAGTDLNVRNFVLYIAYILILSGLSMILTIYFAIRFYKNLYTDEGYLMHTLPVKPWMLIVSKLTIGTIWFYLIDLFLVGAITLITLIALPTMAYFSPAACCRQNPIDAPGIALCYRSIQGILCRESNPRLQKGQICKNIFYGAVESIYL